MQERRVHALSDPRFSFAVGAVAGGESLHGALSEVI